MYYKALAKGARCAPLLDTPDFGAFQALSLVRTIRTRGRSITTWGASELPKGPMARVETSLSPLEPPSTNGHFIAPWTPRPTVRRLDAVVRVTRIGDNNRPAAFWLWLPRFSHILLMVL